MLVIYHQERKYRMLEANAGHLYSLRRYSKHKCFYYNAARTRVPRHITSLNPDLVVFHYTLLVHRRSPESDRIARLLDFVRDLPARKVALTSDESWCSNQLIDMLRRFGVSDVFSFAPTQARDVIYSGVGSHEFRFHQVQSACIDEHLVKRIARLSRRDNGQHVDIGCRLYSSPLLGRHGQLRIRIGEVFQERAPAFGFTADISSEYMFGDEWLRFLLRCRYQLGVETGSSLLDRDGRVLEYVEAHDGVTLGEVETLFPGLDGSVDYRALAPRHLEAVVAKTCQVLVEGDYSGVLRPGEHYIEVKRDFSNVSQVLGLMQNEDLRRQIVDRAYKDIVLSGRYSYERFAALVFSKSLPEPSAPSGSQLMRLFWNRIDEGLSSLSTERLRHCMRSALRRAASSVLGEKRLRHLIRILRRVQ